MTTYLGEHYRGDTFRRTFTLTNEWVGSDFTGGVLFTLRTSVPSSSTTSDSDAVDQASAADGEITFSGADGEIIIPAERSTSWPARRLRWDIQGIVSGSPDRVYTIDSGEIVIVGDITRSQG